MQKSKRNLNNWLLLYQKDKIFFQLLIIAVLVFGAVAFMKPDKFLTSENILSMLTQFPQFGIMTFGVMLAMLLGGIDLSIVAIANLSSIVAAFIMTGGTGAQEGREMAILAGIIAAVIVGAAAGLINGVVISNFHVPAMLATIGTAQVFQGVSIALTKGKAISGLPEAYSSIGGLNVAGILPVPFLVFIICAVILGFILARTTFGANIYMLGTNVKAAGYSGIKVRSYTLAFCYRGNPGSVGRDGYDVQNQQRESGLWGGLHAAVRHDRNPGRRGCTRRRREGPKRGSCHIHRTDYIVSDQYVPGTEYIYQDTDMGTYPDCRHGMENVLERLKERRALCKTKAQCG